MTRMVSLAALLPEASFVACGDLLIRHATADSRRVRPGMLFAALPGPNVDGSQFVAEAISSGARAVMIQRPQPLCPVPQCVVPNPRQAYAKLCVALQVAPQKIPRLFGVTGTNGKTTTTWFLRSVLQAAGRDCGMTGTIETSVCEAVAAAEMTTPSPDDLAMWLSALVERQCTDGVLEISSHALHQHRCDGLQLTAAAITNITRDHLDYHADFESYRLCKESISRLIQPGGLLILNQDDPASRDLRSARHHNGPIVRIAERSERPDSMADADFRLAGEIVEFRTPKDQWACRLKLPGAHNAANALTAALLAEAAGVPRNAIQHGLESLSHIPGRLEPIICGQPFQVLVDYAHTPDGLRQTLRCCRQQASGRVICVFGAGGDRDRAKRPLMGQAAAEADVIVLTSDNPRSEPPHQILADIADGIPSGPTVIRREDRLDGIQCGLESANPGDLVVICGRGHERSQQIGDRVFSFQDAAVARYCLKQLMESASRSSNPLEAVTPAA